MTTPTVYQSTWTQSLTEKLDLGFDASNYLQAGQSVANPSSILISQVTGEEITLAHAPYLGANSVFQRIDGPAGDLPRTGTYLLIVNFDAPPSDNHWAMELQIIAVL